MSLGRGRNTVLRIFRKYILLKAIRAIITEGSRGKLSILFPMEIGTAGQLSEKVLKEVGSMTSRSKICSTEDNSKTAGSMERALC